MQQGPHSDSTTWGVETNPSLRTFLRELRHAPEHATISHIGICIQYHKKYWG